MNAPHPSLNRLLLLAAAPAQHMKAWRESGDALAALDREVDASALDNDARLEALLVVPQVGRLLAGALARLGEAAADIPADELPARGPGEPPMAGASPWSGGLPMPAGAAPMPQPRSAGPATAQPLPKPRLASAPGPDAPDAEAGVDAVAPRGHRQAPPQARRTSRWPAGSRIEAKRLPPAPDAPAPAASQAVPRLRAAVAPLRDTPRFDATAATESLASRAARADLGSAWQQTIELPVARAGALPALEPARALAAAAGAAAAPETAANTVSQRDWRARAHARATVESGAAAAPRAARSALSALAAAAGAPAGVVLATRAATPLTAARIGGFRGLAALGRVRAGGAGDALPTSAPAPGPVAPRPQPPVLDPQVVIDHVEAALREQAARGGISIEGTEP